MILNIVDVFLLDRSEWSFVYQICIRKQPVDGAICRLYDESRLPRNSGARESMESQYTRVIFYVRRIGLYLYKYKIYGTISIYILKGLAFVYQLILILHH